MEDDSQVQRFLEPSWQIFAPTVVVILVLCTRFVAVNDR